MKNWILAVCFCLIAFGFNPTIQAQDQVGYSVAPPLTSGSSKQDKLNGQVRRVRVETARVMVKEGKNIEAPRIVREITTYDPKGQKIDSVAYPSQDGTSAGKQQYQYDDKGNIIEMILRGKDGSILSKEKYNYEFDGLGNWKKMITFVAVYENGNIGYEPVEITYRTITYYFGQGIAMLVNAPVPTTVSNVTAASSDTSPTTTEQSTTIDPRANVTGPGIATSDVNRATDSKHTRSTDRSTQQAYTPSLDSPERRAIVGALRAIVARELKKPLIFKIRSLRVKDGRAEVTATPLQPNLQRFDYSNTPYEKCMTAGDCQDSLTAVLQKEKVAWTVVEYVIGSKDVPATRD